MGLEKVLEETRSSRKCQSMTQPIRSAIIAVALLLTPNSVSGQDQIDFAKQIRPILSDTCFKCHGPDEDERQADLRLDLESSVFDDSDVIQRGQANESTLYQRIMTDDDDLLMPPHDSGRQLTDDQKELIKNWIDQGATWQKHWSFIPPEKPALPVLKNSSWPKNQIDHFILQRLEQADLDPNPNANRSTLIRRLCLDLTGLPPTPDFLDRHRQNTNDNWYESLVDELLASDHYGEHMARYWLDAARYGDTHGLHLDNYREMWLYRDWVIDSFNQNKSFKDFTIEQLAGDLLPNPTEQQLIATGFNRSHVTTNEGGSISEEVYVRNVVDRASTMGTVFLGLTVGCAQCHDHKFDPISQQEFYQLFAFFNNLDGNPMDGNVKDHAPILKVPTTEQKTQVAELEKKLQASKEHLKHLIANFEYVDPGVSTAPADHTTPTEYVWLDDDVPERARKEQTWNYVTSEQNAPVHSGKNSRRQKSSDSLVQHFFTGATEALTVVGEDQLFAYVFLDPEDPPAEIMLQFNDGSWDHRAYWGGNRIEWGQNKSASRFYMGELPETGKWIRLEVNAADVGFNDRRVINGIAFTQWGGTAHWDSAGTVSRIQQNYQPKSMVVWANDQMKSGGKGLPAPIAAIIKIPFEKWNEQQSATAREHFLTHVYGESKTLASSTVKEIKDLSTQIDKAKKSWPSSLIWKERKEIKPAFVLNRGEYDQKGEPVTRAVPDALPPFPANAPLDRLGLALWLVDSEHPLTSRVTVNRFWQQIFGRGIVQTSEDFGAQGTHPSHPELLDWLATDFVDSDWDVKRLMKKIVMSATYRQSAKLSPELARIDPDNSLLARGARFRLDAETLRDQALVVSNLMVPTIGGPSVKPPQPDGLWFVVGYSGSNTVRFRKDNGHEKVHRRSLYTFWKRTAPAPQMNTFDAPSRESCVVRRERTNTPLQALLLMNDPQYVEAARHLAQTILDSSRSETSNGETPDEMELAQIRHLYEKALSRQPQPDELSLVSETLNQNRREFNAQPDSAKRLIQIGESPANTNYDTIELAAWTMVANLIMNTDEFVSRN